MGEIGINVLALSANEQVNLGNCARNQGGGFVLTLPTKEQGKFQNCARNYAELNKEVGYLTSDEAEFVRFILEENSGKEASNVHTDGICVGDSDPVVIQNDNLNGLSSEILSRNKADDFCVGGNNNQANNSGEITSESSTHSYTDSGFCTNYATRDSPEDVNPKESHKIRLRIRKRSEECSSNKSNSAANELRDGIRTDDEQRDAKRRVLPSKGVGKVLHPQSTSLVTGTKINGGNADGKKRNDSLHKLLFLPKGLSDGTYLAYNVKGQAILEGYKKDNGIFCNHCSNVVSPSQFEAHAGMAARKKPYQHIYTADGRTLHDIAGTLAKGMSNDEIRLATSDSVNSSRRRKPNIVKMRKRANKKSETDGNWTCVLCTATDFNATNNFDDRMVIICDQCEKEYHVGCLRENGRCDLKELPEGKWFCCCDCEEISTLLTNLVARGSEAIPSSETSKINKKLMKEGLDQVGDNDVRLRLLKGKNHPEHKPLLSEAISIFEKGFGPIIPPDGDDLIPPMVEATNQEFGGMYCVVLTVQSVIVSVGLLRILGREVAEVPLVATKENYKGKGYLRALFSYIEKLIGFLKVENLLLPATTDAKPMWINKFGFRKISETKYKAYTRVFPLTTFYDTTQLEKQVQQ